MSGRSSKDQAGAGRQARLAKALRDNLRKRKAQTRERGATSSADLEPDRAERTAGKGDGEA
jgi:hypothetical protein